MLLIVAAIERLHRIGGTVARLGRIFVDKLIASCVLVLIGLQRGVQHVARLRALQWHALGVVRSLPEVLLSALRIYDAAILVQARAL